MDTSTMKDFMGRAWAAGTAIPGFNIPYLPMMEPVVQALRDTRCFGLIMVARLEWMKFQAKGIREIFEEYQRVKDERFTRLHLDHVPVIDEDGLRVDYLGDLGLAAELGYHSIMVDASRLPFAENVAATKQVVDMAHARGIPVEAELGAVLGHEAGPLPPYEELFASGKGFTDPEEALRFVRETWVDWLSVAVGSVHGAISGAARKEKKVEAKISIERLDAIRQLVQVPLVLHGGSGIRKEHVLESIRHGIAKINVGMAIRQPYERLMEESVAKAQEAAYAAVVRTIREELELENSAEKIRGW